MSHGNKSLASSSKFWVLFVYFRYFLSAFQLLVSAAFQFEFKSFSILLQVFDKKWHTICQQNVAYPVAFTGKLRDAAARRKSIENWPGSQVFMDWAGDRTGNGEWRKQNFIFYYISERNNANAANVNRKRRQSKATKWSFLDLDTLHERNSYGRVYLAI